MEEDLSSNDIESQSLESEKGKENTAVIYKPPSGIHFKRTDTKLEAVTKCTRDKRISSLSTDSVTTNRPHFNATTFKASQLLDASFSEWLTEKEKERKHQQKVIKEFKLKQEEEASLKKAVKEERSKEAIERWRQNKRKDLIEKAKRKEEQSVETSKEVKDQQEKQKCSEEAAKKWRLEKARQLKEIQQEKAQKEKKRKEEKIEELEERIESSTQAFKAWCEKKDKIQEEVVHKKINERKQLTQRQLSEKQDRQEQSKSAYVSWKSAKDKKLKESQTLYTYNPDPRQPPKHNKWCPVRGIKYSYPADPRFSVKKKSANTEGIASVKSTESYSNCSFDSDNDSIGHEEPTCTSTPYNSSIEDTAINKTGKLKEITVCCQTLEYWCTCHEENDD